MLKKIVQILNYKYSIYIVVLLISIFCVYCYGVNNDSLIYRLKNISFVGDAGVILLSFVLLTKHFYSIRIEFSIYSFLWFLFAISIIISTVLSNGDYLRCFGYAVALFSYYYLFSTIIPTEILFLPPIIFASFAMVESLVSGNLSFEHFSGIFLNTNGLGQVLSLSTVCLISLSLLIKEPIKLLGFIILILNGLFIFASASRTSIISYFLCLFLYLILINIYNFEYINTQKTLLIIFTLLCAFALLFFLFPSFRSIINNMLSPMVEKSSHRNFENLTSGRDLIWKEIWKSRTLFATNIDTVRMGSHSLFFGLIRNFGLISFYSFLAILAVSFFEIINNLFLSYRYKCNAENCCAILLYTCFMIIYGFTEDISSILNYHFLSMMSVLATNHRVKFNTNNIVSRSK